MTKNTHTIQTHKRTLDAVRRVLRVARVAVARERQREEDGRGDDGQDADLEHAEGEPAGPALAHEADPGVEAGEERADVAADDGEQHERPDLLVRRGVGLLEPDEAAPLQEGAVAARDARRDGDAHDDDRDRADEEAAPRQLLAPAMVLFLYFWFVCLGVVCFVEWSLLPSHRTRHSPLSIIITNHHPNAPRRHLHREQHAADRRLERRAHAARRAARDEVADVAVVRVRAPVARLVHLLLEPRAAACFWFGCVWLFRSVCFGGVDGDWRVLSFFNEANPEKAAPTQPHNTPNTQQTQQQQQQQQQQLRQT